MSDIKITPEQLLAQSSQMADIQSSFEEVFSKFSNILEFMNSSWSAVIAHNFTGKIQSAQNVCSKIVEMFGNGADSAKMSALILSDEGNVNMDGTLQSLMDMAEKGAFKDIDKLVKDITTGKDASIMSNILGGNYDTESVKKVLKAAAGGDKDEIVKTIYEKGKDLFGSAMSVGSGGGWVEKLDKYTGGKLGLSDLQGNYFKNWVFDSGEKAVDIVKNMYGDNPDYKELGYQLSEFAWNMGPGSVAKTCGDAASKVIDNIPVIKDFYAEQGAVTAGEKFSAAYGEAMRTLSADNEVGDYYKNYYSDHGGAARGIFDGFKEIGSFIKDSVSNPDLIKNLGFGSFLQ